MEQKLHFYEIDAARAITNLSGISKTLMPPLLLEETKRMKLMLFLISRYFLSYLHSMLH